MSSSVRFVHCGGFLFDSRSWEGPLSWINMRNQDLWRTFEAVLKLCRTEKADFLFLTGDLFDQEYACKETVERVAKALGRLKGTKVFITPGEKDPLVTTNAYRFAEWPDNVHIFPGGLNHVEVPSRGVTIYGSGWTTYKQEKNYLEGFLTVDKNEEIKFMLLHTEVDAVQNTKGFIPLQFEQIEASGLTYLALGHKQKWSGIQKAGDTYWADCGAVEARSFAENGPHGVLLGETDGIMTQIEFRELGQRRYMEKYYQLPSGVKEITAQLLEDTTGQERQKDLFRLKLSGSSGETETDIELLRELLTDKFSHLEILADDTVPNSQPGNDLATLTEVFMNETQTQLASVHSSEKKRHWELVQKIGATALSQGRVNPEPQRPTDLEVKDQKGHIFWPDSIEHDFYRRVRNLRQVGDEGFSLEKARDSLARARKRVEEQETSMDQVKADYDELRRDWEAANRRQEEQRLLQIEIKNLQAKQNHVTEKITSLKKTLERLALLHQNPDYRELRQLQGELPRLEERRRNTEEALTAYTRSTKVDWDMIEGLREEYLEWALIQEEMDHVEEIIYQDTQRINEAENIIEVSGYKELSNNEDQRLRQLQEEWSSAQEDLKKLTPLVDEFSDAEEIFHMETTKLKKFAVIAGVSAPDERRITHTEQLLTKWQSSRISSFIDRFLKEQLELTSIEEKLVSRLARYYQKYQVTDYDEFQSLQQEFRNQQQVVRSLQTKLAGLRKEAEREKALRRIVQSRNQMLQNAFSMAHAANFSEWLNGWEDYCQRKNQLVQMHDELRIKTEQQQANEEKLTEYANQLREKVKNWASSSSNIDEVLAGVIQASSKLRAKEEAEKEFNALNQRYIDQLSKRDMNQLVAVLEPLADLEREEGLSEEEKQAKLLAWNQELAEIKSQLSQTQKKLEHNRSLPGIQAIEKKLEAVKLQLKTYEELQCALEATQELLEACQKKWQITYGKALGVLAKNIFSRTFFLQPSVNNEDIISEAKKYYFAYRMALTLLALENNLETPIYFSVGGMKEQQVFWEDILAYLQELSLSRQIIFDTSDVKLRRIAKEKEGLLVLEGD